jgi:hypothetical protein
MILDYLKELVVDFWAVAAEMSPYLLFGFLIAGVFSVLLPEKFINKHLSGKGLLPVFKASAFGVPLPLCSCGVIPVATSLYKRGASKASTISFLISTPQTGVDGMLVTYSLLGWLFAIFKPIVAFITGMLGGVLTSIFSKKHNISDEPDNSKQQCPHCENDQPNEQGYNQNIIKRIFKHGFVALPRDVGKAMLFGLALAALISALVPDDFFAEKLGRGFLPLVIMMFAGIPVYVCTTASVPVAAAMILKGLSPGAAFVFLMTGPATNAATFVTVWKILGRAPALVYIFVVAGCSLIFGLLLDWIVVHTTLEVVTKPTQMLPDIVKNLSAVILLAVLLTAIFTAPKQHEHSNKDEK